MSEVIWNDGKDKFPTKDGRYLVWEIGEPTIMNYTVEYGWNTIRFWDGSVSNEFRLDNVKKWAEVPSPFVG